MFRKYFFSQNFFFQSRIDFTSRFRVTLVPFILYTDLQTVLETWASNLHGLFHHRNYSVAPLSYPLLSYPFSTPRKKKFFILFGFYFAARFYQLIKGLVADQVKTDCSEVFHWIQRGRKPSPIPENQNIKGPPWHVSITLSGNFFPKYLDTRWS